MLTATGFADPRETVRALELHERCWWCGAEGAIANKLCAPCRQAQHARDQAEQRVLARAARLATENRPNVLAAHLGDLRREQAGLEVTQTTWWDRSRERRENRAAGTVRLQPSTSEASAGPKPLPPKGDSSPPAA